MSNDGNGWNEYSRLVLEQLETLAAGIEAVREEMSTIRQELAIMKAKEDRVQDLKLWKEKMSDVTSPPQLRVALREVEDLKIFKTKAITIFMIAQAFTGFILAYAHLI